MSFLEIQVGTQNLFPLEAMLQWWCGFMDFLSTIDRAILPVK